MTYKYMFQGYDEKKMARALGSSLPISRKHSIEIVNKIRGKSLERAKKILRDVVDEKKPIKYTRFNKDLAHRPGIASGRYPVKAATNILKLVESVEKNATQKGISIPQIIHIAVNSAPQQWHYGRHRRRRVKKAHVEIVVSESKEKKQTKKQEVKQQEVKQQEVKQQEVKQQEVKQQEVKEVKQQETPKEKSEDKKEDKK